MLAQGKSQGPPGELAFPGASYDSNPNAWYSYPVGPVRVGENEADLSRDLGRRTGLC